MLNPSRRLGKKPGNKHMLITGLFFFVIYKNEIFIKLYTIYTDMAPTTMKKNIDTRQLSYDEQSKYCPRRNRDLKKVGKSYSTLKGCNRKIFRDYRDKKRVKESRSRKKVKRPIIENINVLDNKSLYWIDRAGDPDSLKDFKGVLQSSPVDSMKIHMDILDLVSFW
jgi:hypothetical protein